MITNQKLLKVVVVVVEGVVAMAPLVHEVL
jgi:hypothetical protein